MDAGAIIGLVGLGVTIAGSLITLVYQMGRFSARVESLEAWRSQMQTTLDKLFTELRTIASAVGIQRRE